MDNQNQSNSMKRKYCFRCGAQVGSNGVCPNCGQPVLSQSEYEQPVQKEVNQAQQGYNYGQSGYPQQSYQQVARKAPSGPNLFTYALDYVKAFFSADPTTALDKAVNEKHHVWSILGAGSVLLITFGVFGILLNCVNAVVEAISGIPFAGVAMGSYTEQINDAKVGLFFEPLVIILVFFFASAGLGMLFFKLQKKNVSYIQNLNLLSVAMLPLAVCGGAAFIISFIYIPLALLLLFSGVFFKYIMLYDGLKKIVAFEKNPIWYVFGLVFTNMVSLMLVIYIFAKMVS